VAGPTPRTIVIARVRCRADQRAALLELLTTLQDASRKDDGCVNYGFWQAIEDEHTFIAVEEWRDRDALAAHLRTPHIHEFMAGLPAVVEGTPTIASHEIAGTGPLPF
jgi:quinol monooxygenase YgiN